MICANGASQSIRIQHLPPGNDSGAHFWPTASAITVTSSSRSGLHSPEFGVNSSEEMDCPARVLRARCVRSRSSGYGRRAHRRHLASFCGFATCSKCTRAATPRSRSPDGTVQYTVSPPTKPVGAASRDHARDLLDPVANRSPIETIDDAPVASGRAGSRLDWADAWRDEAQVRSSRAYDHFATQVSEKRNGRSDSRYRAVLVRMNLADEGRERIR